MTNLANRSAVSTPGFDQWLPLRPVEREELNTARSETLNLLQWLVRTANSFVTGATPEERVSLYFRSANTSFVTKTFGNNYSLELRLPTLKLQFLENGKPMPHIFDPEENSPAKVEAWLLIEFLHRGLDRSKFSKNLPYALSGLLTGDADNHSPQRWEQGLSHLTAWFKNAATTIRSAVGISGAGIDIVCMPQTLNLTCVVGPASRQVEIGFSPGGAQIDEPYFYVNPHVSGGSQTGIKRSVLTASKLLAEPDPNTAVMNFIKAAMR